MVILKVRIAAVAVTVLVYTQISLTDYTDSEIADAHAAVPNIIPFCVSVTHLALHVVVVISFIIRVDIRLAMPICVASHHIKVLLQLVQGVLKREEEFTTGVTVT